MKYEMNGRRDILRACNEFSKPPGRWVDPDDEYPGWGTIGGPPDPPETGTLAERIRKYLDKNARTIAKVEAVYRIVIDPAKCARLISAIKDAGKAGKVTPELLALEDELVRHVASELELAYGLLRCCGVPCSTIDRKDRGSIVEYWRGCHPRKDFEYATS